MTQPIGNPSHIGNLDAAQLGPQPTYLPDDHADVEAKKRLDAGEEPIDIVSWPACLISGLGDPGR